MHYPLFEQNLGLQMIIPGPPLNQHLHVDDALRKMTHGKVEYMTETHAVSIDLRHLKFAFNFFLLSIICTLMLFLGALGHSLGSLFIAFLRLYYKIM